MLLLIADAYAGVEIKKSSKAADADDFIEGQYWALIIGINKYPAMDKDKQIPTARKDAEAVAKLLIDRYGFSRERVIELYDETASRKKIIQGFYSLNRRLTDKDSLFIYFSGNGEFVAQDKEKKDGVGYWLPSDAAPDDVSSFIPHSEVRDYLATNPARHILAVVDADYGGALTGKTRAAGLSKSAIKEMYQSKSRWVVSSVGLSPRPDSIDKSKSGHSVFAWHFIKILEKNVAPYLLAKDLSEPLAIRVSDEVPGQLPRTAQLIEAGDDGGQFVFRLRKDLQKGPGPDPANVARLEAERAKAPKSPAEISGPEDQLEKQEEALKKQQEEMAARKQAMLARLKQGQEQAAREAVAGEQGLAAETKSTQDQWATFLKNPNLENYQPLAKNIAGCRMADCAQEVKPQSAAVIKLVALVEQRNLHAIELAFLSRAFLDGGDLEEISRSLGAVADTDPEIFLGQINKHHLTSQQLKSIVKMMPKDTGDDQTKRPLVTQRRIRSLAKVKDQNLVALRDKAIGMLQNKTE
jgi:hypothetical protein